MSVQLQAFLTRAALVQLSQPPPLALTAATTTWIILTGSVHNVIRHGQDKIDPYVLQDEKPHHEVGWPTPEPLPRVGPLLLLPPLPAPPVPPLPAPLLPVPAKR